MKKENVPKQVRIPINIHNFIEKESKKIGISQNAFLVVLLEQGKKVWEYVAKTIEKS